MTAAAVTLAAALAWIAWRTATLDRATRRRWWDHLTCRRDRWQPRPRTFTEHRP